MPPTLTDTQILIVSTVIGLIVSWFTARQTASSESVKSLSLALSSLRGEFEEVKKEYNREKKLNKIFEQYIERLIETLNKNNLEVPKMDPPLE
jgi:hypothetical protein